MVLLASRHRICIVDMSYTSRTPNTSSGTHSLRSGLLAAASQSVGALCLEQLFTGDPSRRRVFAP
eukprot:2381961-Prymnesium_polylepis.1